MSEIIKVCKKHGELTLNEVYIIDRPYPTGKIGKRISCKKCESLKVHKSYRKHRESRILTAKKWQAKNPERKKLNRKIWGKENADYVRQYKRKKGKIQRLNAERSYVIKLLRDQGYESSIAESLVPVKSALILLKRVIKKCQK